MKNLFSIPLLLALILFLTACEQEYIPVKTGEGQKFVVEGYIEAGENPLPPYVIVTKTLDFFSEIGPEQFSASFVHGADVRVSDGSKEIKFEGFHDRYLRPASRISRHSILSLSSRQ